MQYRKFTIGRKATDGSLILAAGASVSVYVSDGDYSTLATGVVDANGVATNPLTADANGQIVIGAPGPETGATGIYDVRAIPTDSSAPIDIPDQQWTDNVALAEQVAADAASTATDAATAAAAAASAEVSADAAQNTKGLYPTTANALSDGVVGLASLVAGSGGTDGTYDLAFSGGAGSNAAGVFTVVSGAIESYVITYPGYDYTSAPTVSFAAATGLTGASATAVLAQNVTDGQYFNIPDSDDAAVVQLWQNVSDVATDTGKRTPSLAAVNTLKDSLTTWSARSYPAYTAGSYLSRTTGLPVANANFHYSFLTLTGDEERLRVTGIVESVASALAIYYDGSDAVIGYQVAGTGTPVGYTDYELTIPAGTAKIGFSCRSASAPQADYVFEEGTFQNGVAAGLASAQSDISDQQTESAAIKAAVTDWTGPLAYSAYTAGAYLSRTTGLPVANVNFHYAYYTLSGDEQSIRISGVIESASSARALYYDADDNFLGYEAQGTGSPVTYTDYELTLPLGTAKIGLSCRTSATAHEVNALEISDITARLGALETSGATGGAVTIWGDSTSASGSKGIGDELTALLAPRIVYSQGIGGQQWIDKIQYRMGVVPFTLSVSGGSIPATGTADCTPSVSLLAHNTLDVVAQISVLGVRCALRYIQSTDSYTIEALDDLSAAVTVADNSTARVLTGFVTGTAADAETCTPLGTLLDGLQIIRSCTSINDRFGIDYDEQCAAFDAAKAHLAHYTQHVLWLGMMNGGSDLTTADGGDWATEAESYAVLSFVRHMNSYIADRAGRGYVDPLANHIANGGGETVNVSGVDFVVLTDTAATPKLQDKRHETSDAQTSTANLVVAKISELGW